MKKNLIARILIVVAVFLGGYYIGQFSYVSGVNFGGGVHLLRSRSPSTVGTGINLDLFRRVEATLQERYIDRGQLDSKAMLYGAIRGMVDSLGDPYTAFFTPEQNVAFRESLEGVYEGIGAQLGFRNGQLVVVAPLKESPSEKAGVKAGDVIIAVNEGSTQGWSLPEAVQQIRGERGTQVVLTLQRDNSPGQTGVKPFEVTVVRERIRSPSVQLVWVGERQELAHLRIFRFGPDTNKGWDETISDVRAKIAGGLVKGVVLDVRNNPGGFLDSAIHIGSEFFDRGTIVKREYANGSIEKFEVDHTCNLCKIPVVVLVNRGSASASEIVAGAIKTRSRGQLVGEQTFGKGTIQEAIDLPGGAGLHITTARWLLPDDQNENIHGEGIQPDVLMKNPEDRGADELDPQLEKAISVLEQ